MPGIDQRSRLLHMLAQHLAQTGMKQMRSGVVAHGGGADICIHDGIHLHAHMNGLPSLHFVRTHTLDWCITTGYVGYDGVVLVVVKNARVADLSAGVSVERCVI